MNAGYEIGINLASAGIGAVIGGSSTYVSDKFKYRRHRAFWRFLKEPTIFVIGDLPADVLLKTLWVKLKPVIKGEQDWQLIEETIQAHLNEQEVSGLIGRGDLDAVVRMLAKFASLRLPGGTLVLHPAQVRDRRAHNLVLIGGNDTNSLTNEVAPRLGCHFESRTDDNGHNVITDSRLNSDHPVTWKSEPSIGGEMVDYGMIARGPSPYNPHHEVLLIAGAHGWGSLAAAEVCLSPRFEKRLYNDWKEYGGRFECLVSYKRLDGGPPDGQETIALEISRPLDVPSAQH
jgi:hypothetical protein